MPFAFIVKTVLQKIPQDFPTPAGCPVMSVSVICAIRQVENRRRNDHPS